MHASHLGISVYLYHSHSPSSCIYCSRTCPQHPSLSCLKGRLIGTMRTYKIQTNRQCRLPVGVASLLLPRSLSHSPFPLLSLIHGTFPQPRDSHPLPSRLPLLSSLSSALTRSKDPDLRAGNDTFQFVCLSISPSMPLLFSPPSPFSQVPICSPTPPGNHLS